MNYRDNTEDELIKKLQKLKQENNSFKKSYPKYISGNKKEMKPRYKAEEVRWHTLVKTIPDYIAIHDNEGNFLFLNHYAVGFTEKDVIGTNLYNYISPDSMDSFRQNFEKCLHTGKIQIFEYKAFGDSNSIKTYETTLVPVIEQGKVSNIMSIAKDITERKLSELALQESEERFRLLFENSGEAILLTNPDGSIYNANPEACNIFQMSEDEICEKGRYGVLDLKDTRLEFDLNERRRTGKFKGELNLIRKDRTRFPADVTSTIFRDSSGKEKTCMIIRDISERKLSEEHLKASEAVYRSLFENSIIAISQAHPGGGLLKINKAYAEMYGYPDTSTMLNEISGKTEILFSNPDDRIKVLEALENNDSLSPAEFELNRRNGEKFWALVGIRQVKDNAGKLLYLQAEHIDITSQKKLEKDRYLTSLYARNLLEASLDPLVTISKDGKITDVNIATEEITGIKRNKLIGTDFADYFTNPDKAKKGYKIVFSKGMVKDYSLTIVSSNGTKTDVLYNATVFKNDSDEVQGVFAAARDITDRKVMEEELRRSKKLLEKLHKHLADIREDERNKIALNLHDDLGQKLTAINLNIKWIKSRMGVQTKVVKERIEEMSRIINESIESIREISSFLRPAILFDLGLVPAFEWQLKRFELQSGIKCFFHHQPEEFLLDTSVSLILYRVLQESLTNIARHSEATEANITLHKLKKKIEMLIKDNGIGIDEEKANSPASMGIAGIKERVRSVHGNVLVKGKKENWTYIKVSIPVKTLKKHD
jgi:PAS domain S-box-containing protein